MNKYIYIKNFEMPYDKIYRLRENCKLLSIGEKITLLSKFYENNMFIGIPKEFDNFIEINKQDKLH